ncbi:MAG: DNA recombination protein RmuC, partial [Muribaculaceae bacterium]|nr:DNA recombination protein RmuC [Muribaculaceae bacterium]
MEVAIVVGLMAVVMLIAGALVMIQRMRNEMVSREKDARMREEQAQMRERASLERERMAMDRLAQIEKRSNEMKMEMQLQFEHLSNKVLREQCATIDERNMRQLNQLLNPLKTRIEDFTRQAMEADIRQNATQKSLTDQLERLMNLNMSIGEEARNLTKALPNDSKTQGDWGE